MNKHLSSLMDKEVSRKDFLTMLALATASVFGMGTLLKLLTGKSLETNHVNVVSGYGASVYGGVRKK